MLTHSYGCNPMAGVRRIFVCIMLQVSEKLKLWVHSLIAGGKANVSFAEIHAKHFFANAAVYV